MTLQVPEAIAQLRDEVADLKLELHRISAMVLLCIQGLLHIHHFVAMETSDSPLWLVNVCPTPDMKGLSLSCFRITSQIMPNCREGLTRKKQNSRN